MVQFSLENECSPASIFLMAASECGHVTGSIQGHVNDILYVSSVLIWFILGILCVLLSPVHYQQDVNLNGNLESLVLVLVDPLPAWIPTCLYGTDNSCPSSSSIKNKFVVRIAT